MNITEKRNLLTIIIPTYNRCVQVKENLDLTIPQVMEYQDEVVIYISDNASTDGTCEMVRSYLEQYPNNVFYYCQKENITASPNFNHAVHAVNSEYVFVLGDDDILFPNFVQTVLELIKKNPDVGLFHFNYLFGFNNLSYCKLLHSDIDPKNFLKKYENGKSFILDNFNGPSFISSNLFKRSLWLEGVKSMKEDCLGYVWFSILLFGCVDYPCAYYSLPMLIQQFPQTARYTKNWPLYYIFGLGSLFEYLDEQHPGLYAKWMDYSQNKNYRNIIFALSKTTYYRKFYRENKSKIKKHLSRRMLSVYFSLCLIPFPKFFTGKIIPLIVKIMTFRKRN